MTSKASSISADGAMEPRVRKLEVDYAMLEQKLDSLFDNGSPGLLSQLRNTLSEKIDRYFETVTKFIEGEPGRKAHIERNAQQAVMDAKEIAHHALKTAEAEQMRMHTENRRVSEHTETQVAALASSLARHEKFVQRGVGAVILGQVFIVLGGFMMTLFTFAGAAMWWIFSHVPLTK